MISKSNLLIIAMALCGSAGTVLSQCWTIVPGLCVTPASCGCVPTCGHQVQAMMADTYAEGFDGSLRTVQQPMEICYLETSCVAEENVQCAQSMEPGTWNCVISGHTTGIPRRKISVSGSCPT